MKKGAARLLFFQSNTKTMYKAFTFKIFFSIKLFTIVLAPTELLAGNHESLGAVSTSHPLATEAGEAILQGGGNSIDAIISASLVLSVVEPTMSGLGGRAQALVSEKGKKFVGYNGMTEIPQSFVYTDALPTSGYSTVAVPGLVALLAKMHSEFGSVPFEQLTSHAIDYAEKGVRFLPGERARQQSVSEKIYRNLGMREIFTDESGDIHPENHLTIQKALANTLRLISNDPHKSFYQGDIAKSIARDSQNNSGFIELEDVNNYEIVPGNYFSFKYRDRVIHSLAAPAGGMLIAKSLSILKKFDYADFDEDRWATLVSQSLALSIKSMNEDYYEKNPAAVLETDWTEKQLAKVRLPTTNNAYTRIGNEEISHKTDWILNSNSHTSHLSVFDCNGLAVSLTQTLGPIFGAKVLTKELGFPYASTMGSYLRTGKQKPGQRPRTSIAPVIVTKDRDIEMVIGAAGGIRIPSAITQVLSRVIDQKMDLDEAISAPRIHPKMSINEENERVINLKAFEAEMSDNSWGENSLKYWIDNGFDVESKYSRASFGRVNAVMKKSNVIIGESDPDWEGAATTMVTCN